MATVGTNTIPVGTVSSYTVLMNPAPSNVGSAGTVVGFNPFPESTTVLYAQRVYSSGLSQWCYYVQSTINPSPASGDTTPNWTGSITAHEVLAVLD